MLEKLLTGPNITVLALMVLCALMMRNSAVRSRNSRGRDLDKELKNELRARQKSAQGQIHQLEIRLHDYDRDVAARVQTTMAMLDRLIEEADLEIARLETLLENRQTPLASSLPANERRMVAHLAGAGYSIGEIARLTGRSEEAIAQVLESVQNRRAA